MHSHQEQYILYYINHQSSIIINQSLTSINHLTSINQTIDINDNMIQHVELINTFTLVSLKFQKIQLLNNLFLTPQEEV
jgi:hypothetical protein